MADLPPERLLMKQQPFTYTDVDCLFGPIYAKFSRRTKIIKQLQRGMKLSLRV